jgi:Right handed beta helix region
MTDRKLSNPNFKLALFLGGMALLCYWPFPAQTQVALPRFFFVDSELGRDSAPGTSTRWPWRSVNRVNQGVYRAGDTILFRGGQRFEGSLNLTARNAAGSTDNPIIISSYGDGRAAIASSNGHGLSAVDIGGLRITEINFAGAVQEGGNGVGLYFNITGNRKTPSVQIDHVDVSGYLIGGLISVQRPAVLDGLTISDVEVHDNRWAGLVIAAQDPAGAAQTVRNSAAQPTPTLTPSPAPPQYSLKNLSVQTVHSHNNNGLTQDRFNLPESRGAGIYIANVDGATVRECRIENNGAPPPDVEPSEKDPVLTMFGVTVTGRRLLVESNEVTSQRIASKTGFGGGIRVRSGNALVQYDYVHDNDGVGLRIETSADGALEDPPSKVVVRYNIGQSAASHAGRGVLSVVDSITELDIHNNTLASIAEVSPATPADSLPSLPVLSIEAGGADAPPLLLRALNNIFVSKGTVPVLHVASLPEKSDLRLEGNAYVDPSGSYRIEWGNDSHSEPAANLPGRLAQLNIETMAREFVLKPESPLPLVLFVPDAKVPAKLSDLQLYLLVDGSPLLNAGLNTLASFGFEAGDRDFWGNALPKDGNPDTGACECSKNH